MSLSIVAYFYNENSIGGCLNDTLFDEISENKNVNQSHLQSLANLQF